jgi:hypothetical protein
MKFYLNLWLCPFKDWELGIYDSGFLRRSSRCVVNILVRWFIAHYVNLINLLLRTNTSFICD